MDKKQFIEELSKINIEISAEKLSKLEKYYQMLIEWNEKINLTAITEEKDVYLKHFYDSITASKIIDLNNEQTLCDIGTGAGFPGIVLKIFYPELNITLVDSLNKRIVFLQEVIKELKLKKITAVHARAEEFAREHRECFDVVIARAVAPINILLEYCIPMIKENKYFISMKGDISREINFIECSTHKINAQVSDIKEFLLPIEGSKRSLISFTKQGKTPMKYPRKNSEIKKNPL
ncbi:MAG: 16S rRNA (guanine(527)-N(7))-methyltransferase RsmG [Firmicutes bacterium]|nr:16S rRNA (guanine(527)-N(7))-methyltransferase RsmG [Bacillota bacterium]